MAPILSDEYTLKRHVFSYYHYKYKNKLSKSLWQNFHFERNDTACNGVEELFF